MTNLFDTQDMAAGYASARPPIHARILSDWARQTAAPTRVRRALDIGCGSGLSTRALDAFAERSIGVEPSVSMLRWARKVAPAAGVAAAIAEALPLPDNSVDLATAAGSLNFVGDLERCLKEAHRVLGPAGTLLVYDFAPGRRAAGSLRLDEWFAAFTARYSYPSSGSRFLDPAVLGSIVCDFTVRRSASLVVTVPMRQDEYAAYVMTETNVTAAVRAGTASPDIGAWVKDSLRAWWGDGTHDVLFDAYWVEMSARRDAH